MKKFAALLLTFLMAVSLAACAGNSNPAETNSSDTENSISEETSVSESSAVESEPKNEVTQPDETESAEPASETETEAEGTKVLVAYFSATGTTEGVAEHIANGLNADIYEIVPEDPYTDADLNYNDNNSRTTIEMNDPSARPAISGSVENMDQYDIVFIGYPIWWGEAPRIVSTFMESYDFSGKTIVPFCTSGGSGMGSSATNLEQLTSGATWLDGQRLNGGDSQDTVMEWVNGLGLSLGE
ncbi:MAG: flavodoxin [Eubacteriales bacterium]|nr:flavodoxin [Eubacteriales bacterium]